VTKRNWVPIDEVQSSLADWFKKRPEWIQDSARRFLQNGAFRAADIEELILLCKKEAGVRSDATDKITARPIPDQSFNVPETARQS
jgi:hypothetical protein